MIQVGFLLLICIAAVTAGAPAPPAPDLKPCVTTLTAATNFDVKKMEGIWYEVRSIAGAHERQGTCEATKYKANADGSLNVDLGWIDTRGAAKKVSRKISTAGANPTDAQLAVAIEENPLMYTIFHLDYNSLFGVYACIDNKAYVWVYARTKEVADKALDPITKAITASGLDAKSLKSSAQTGCPAVVS